MERLNAKITEYEKSYRQLLHMHDDCEIRAKMGCNFCQLDMQPDCETSAKEIKEIFDYLIELKEFRQYKRGGRNGNK